MDASSLLGMKNLARTPCRVEILRALISAGSALSENEIRQTLKQGYDRTTIYRTLRSFLSQGIIHSVAIEGHDIRYALSKVSDCQSGNVHVHFHCYQCAGVFCINGSNFVKPAIPESFLAKNYDLIINGVCNKCNDR